MRSTLDGVSIDHVALVILRQDDQIVLVQQQVPSGQRYWVVPGGLVEASELIVDALVREVQEEAGVHVTSVAHLACCSQIDRPADSAQTVAFVFEVETWHGTLSNQDPDGEVLVVEFVPFDQAIHRLQHNGGWPGIQTPLLAYLQGAARAGTIWFYREDADGQHLVSSVPTAATE